MKNAVIYARYSSDNQREESIEGQVRECKEYAHNNNLNITTIYADRALSARTDNRPDFQKMISDSSSKQFEYVLVYKLDRFSRDRYDSAHYKHILKKNNVKVISVTEAIDDSPQGIIMESLMEGMAEYYSAELAQKVRRGEKENALKNKSNGGNIPLGYKVDSNGNFIINEDYSPIVKEVFQRYADGERIKDIVNDLNNRGVTLPKGKSIKYNSFNKMLRNRKYIGEYKYADVITPGGMPAIIDQELFNAVQRRIESNNKSPAKYTAKADYILSGKLYCGECKCRMNGEYGKGRRGNIYYYYKCVHSKKKLSHCNIKTVKKEYIESIVINIINQYVLTDKTIDTITQELYKYQSQDNKLKLLNSQLNKIQSSIDNLLSAIEQGIITKTTKERLLHLEQQKDEIQANITQEQLTSQIFSKTQIKKYLYHLKEMINTDIISNDKLVDLFVNSVHLYTDYVIIVFNGSPQEKKFSMNDVDNILKCSTLNTYGSPIKTEPV